MKIDYKTNGTCSRAVHIELDGQNRITDAYFDGGCNGNTKGICSLIKGMKAEEVIDRLEGTRCGMKPTSCPDQLAKALKSALKK